jgi:hypothetical protein
MNVGVNCGRNGFAEAWCQPANHRGDSKPHCDECRRLDVRYRGEAKNIQRSCTKAVALFLEGVTADEVLDIMGRANSRRGLGDGSTA